MCGRYTLTRQERIAEDLATAVGDDVTAQSEWWKPRYNVAPTQPAPVVIARDGKRVAVMMRWGLVPFWATQPGASKPPLMINARKETLNNKAFFRDALAHKRCLVPADGFFEWRHDDTPKAKGTGSEKKSKKSKQPPQPIYFRPDSGQVFAFAGLWARAVDHGKETLSFTIITGPPNELVAPIHDRMPLVLDPRAHEAWLDPNVDGDAARALLTTPPVGDWHGTPVSTHVNNANNDDPSCIEPARAPLPVQGALFDR